MWEKLRLLCLKYSLFLGLEKKEVWNQQNVCTRVICGLLRCDHVILTKKKKRKKKEEKETNYLFNKSSVSF